MSKNYFRVFSLFVVLFFAFLLPLPADEAVTPAAPAVRTIQDQQRDILSFGTEAEIAALIQTLRNENITYLDAELIEIAERTRNRNILSGIFGFFGEREEPGLEERAIRAITGRDYEVNETVLAAVDYLGRVKAARAADALIELINSGENRFLSNAIRALGRVSRGEGGSNFPESLIDVDLPELVIFDPSDQELPESEIMEPKALPDRIAVFLLDHYQNRRPSDENRREIIVALGETESSEAVSFLSELIVNEDERMVLRMAALGAISRIGDEEGLGAVIQAASSADPHVRSSAVAAMGPFSGAEVENAILDGFRDSFYRTRIGAATAAGMRGLESAIPFLRFRAHNDDVPAVRDEAIRALGAINNSETMAILDSLFTERRNSDRTRLVAAEMLLKNDPDTYSSRVGMEMDEARARNQTALLNGFIRILGPVKSPALEDLARRLITSGSVIERSLALDLILSNEFRNLEDEVRTLLDERRSGASLARKARSTLERLGFEVDVDT
jgi:HEAT repeat protein